VRIFKNTWFSRFAQKEKISDEELNRVIRQLELGEIDADLGGHVFKQRIARPGEGSSGGYRVVVFFKSEEKAFFVYGFAKSDKDNITDRQLQNFKITAKQALALTDEEMKEALKRGIFKEI
jgi:hypothetical protein